MKTSKVTKVFPRVTLLGLKVLILLRGFSGERVDGGIIKIKTLSALFYLVVVSRRI